MSVPFCSYVGTPRLRPSEDGCCVYVHHDLADLFLHLTTFAAKCAGVSQPQTNESTATARAHSARFGRSHAESEPRVESLCAPRARHSATDTEGARSRALPPWRAQTSGSAWGEKRLAVARSKGGVEVWVPRGTQVSELSDSGGKTFF